MESEGCFFTVEAYGEFGSKPCHVVRRCCSYAGQRALDLSVAHFCGVSQGYLAAGNLLCPTVHAEPGTGAAVFVERPVGIDREVER